MTPRECAEAELVSLLGSRIREYVPDDAIDHPAIWVSQCFASLTSAVANGDPSAISIACDLIELDPKLPFGKLIKSDLARALKKQAARLVESERRQLIAATRKLLNLPYAPRELEDYGKLLKKLPLSEVNEMLGAVIPVSSKAQHVVNELSRSAA